MSSAVPILILAFTVVASLVQPRFASFRLRPHWAALIGAVATLATGYMSPDEIVASLRLMFKPMLTLVSLMAMTLIAERVGFFESFTRWLSRSSRGDGKRLFTYLFFGGTVVGALFTNDAAVLILTPLVIALLAEVSTAKWGPRARLPYLFAVLYVANLVGLFVISNPINIVVASSFGVTFGEYFRWMCAPAITSILVTYFGLRFYFRHDLPVSFETLAPPTRRVRTGFRKFAFVVLAITLAGFFTQGFTSIPLPAIACTGAMILALGYVRFEGGSLVPVAKGIAWDVILFVVAIFIIAFGVHNAGATDFLSESITDLRGHHEGVSVAATGGMASVLSAIMNNHPVAQIMALAIKSTELEPAVSKAYVFAALIGGDLGPKMLPIGSLAALLWFRLLRDHDIEVSYWEYIKLGVPVTLLAVAASLAVLLVEIAIF